MGNSVGGGGGCVGEPMNILWAQISSYNDGFRGQRMLLEY